MPLPHGRPAKMVLRKGFRVWRKYKPRSVLLESKEIADEALLFESNTIASLTQVEVDIIRKEYGDCVSAYGCMGVLQISEGTEAFNYLVLITDCQSVGKVEDVEVFRITQTAFAPLNFKASMRLVQDVGKLLASGRFYFSYPSYGAEFNLLACAQKQGKEQRQFFWNRALYSYMRRFGVDCQRWLLRVMCGSVEIQTVYAGNKQAKACLISRLSCERAGTRFQTRGTNDDGHVGNFVETEQAVYVDGNVASFVQIRGVVPLYWEQPGLQRGGARIHIKFSRGSMCSQPAFERHFEWCLLHYGPLLCVNLLGVRDQEQMLSRAFQEHFQQLNSAYCAEMVCFDYHQICKGASAASKLQTVLLPMVNQFITDHGFFARKDGQIQSKQTGTVRSNCLDCLDRSNAVQSFLASHMLVQLITVLGLQAKPSMVSRFQQIAQLAWTRNGDNISWLYAGTRAMEGKGLKLKDGARSVQRTIVNNFLDKAKKEAIDMLLFGNAHSGELGGKAVALLEKADVLAPLNFKQAMVDRWGEYTAPEKLRVCIGTWNVNGGKHIRSIALRNQSLHDWLLDAPLIAGVKKEHPEEFLEDPDIFAIGFQELVGLTASNIVSASSTNRKEWATELQKVLSRDTPYELLTAEQMVGICLYIFIKPKLIPYIRDVEVCTVKTGMSGTAGNKGAVVVHFLVHSTSLCFVCSHLAAHQAKVMERNQDYIDICRRAQFRHGQTLESQDYVFWCGDLNYRINLPTQLAKEHIAARRFKKLVQFEQLTEQKRYKRAFNAFIEGALTFAPTYKYDQFSDDYDTSEKSRTPAWCDRVLWRRKPFVSDPSSGGMTSQLSQVSMSSLASPDSAEAAPDRERSVSPVQWDFGLHPSDAGKVCKTEMEGGGGGALVNTSHPWSPGRLLFYGRAELKQSDHRPVLALLEVDIYRVDKTKRAAVREEVKVSLGPSDPTIVISEGEGRDKGEEGEEEEEGVSIPALLEVVKRFGEVVMVRAIEDTTLITFKESVSAMKATALDGEEVEGVKLQVSLRTPWLDKEEEEEKGEEVEEKHKVAGGEGRWERLASKSGSLVREKPQGKVALLTSQQLTASDEGCGQEAGPEGNEEGLMEFSFVEEPEPPLDELTEAAEDDLEQEQEGLDVEPDPEDGGMEEDDETGTNDDNLHESSSSDEEEDGGEERVHVDGGEEEEEVEEGGLVMQRVVKEEEVEERQGVRREKEEEESAVEGQEEEEKVEEEEMKEEGKEEEKEKEEKEEEEEKEEGEREKVEEEDRQGGGQEQEQREEVGEEEDEEPVHPECTEEDGNEGGAGEEGVAGDEGVAKEEGGAGVEEKEAEEKETSPMEIRVHLATPPPPEKSSEDDVAMAEGSSREVSQTPPPRPVVPPRPRSPSPEMRLKGKTSGPPVGSQPAREKPHPVRPPLPSAVTRGRSVSQPVPPRPTRTPSPQVSSTDIIKGPPTPKVSSAPQRPSPPKRPPQYSTTVAKATTSSNQKAPPPRPSHPPNRPPPPRH